MKTESFDRIVVGAGFAGLSAGYFAGNAGERVLILDKGTGTENASFASTAEMNHDPDVDWESVIDRFGVARARDIWRLTEQAIVLLTAFAHRPNAEHFETKRVPAHLFSSRHATDHVLQHKYDVYKKLGVPVVLEATPCSLHPSFTAALTLGGDGRTNNQALLRTLAHVVRTQGGRILRKCEVVGIDTSGSIPRVVTKSGDAYQGRRIHIATGDQAIAGVRALPIERRRTFVLKYRRQQMPALFRSSIMWDVDEPFHYIRSFAGTDVWIGGEDMAERDVTAALETRAFKRLRDFATNTLGVDVSFTEHGAWSGTFFPTKRSLPYIADDPHEPISYSVGFGGSGLLMSFISGYLHAEWRQKRLRKYQELFALDW